MRFHNKEAEIGLSQFPPPCLHQGLDDRCDTEEARSDIDPDLDGDPKVFHRKTSGPR
jgi:hypothetical protein